MIPKRGVVCVLSFMTPKNGREMLRKEKFLLETQSLNREPFVTAVDRVQGRQGNLDPTRLGYLSPKQELKIDGGAATKKARF